MVEARAVAAEIDEVRAQLRARAGCNVTLALFGVTASALAACATASPFNSTRRRSSAWVGFNAAGAFRSRRRCAARRPRRQTRSPCRRSKLHRDGSPRSDCGRDRQSRFAARGRTKRRPFARPSPRRNVPNVFNQPKRPKSGAARLLKKAEALPEKGSDQRAAPRCAQLFANSLARVQSALFSFCPSLIPATPRVRLRRMPMPSV